MKPQDVPYFALTAENDRNARLVDTIGITQKLDREGGNASNVKVNFNEQVKDRILPASGSKLGELFGQLRRWLDDLKDHAFHAVGKADLDEGLQTELNGKVDNTEDGLNGAINLLRESSVPPKDDDFYVSQYANGGTANTTYWRRRMSALWTYIKGKMASDTDADINGNAATATKATKDGDGNTITDTYARKTSLPTGVWRSNNGGKANTTATTTLTAKQDCSFSLKWRVSSESSYDKLTVAVAGTTFVSAVSGEKNGTIALTPLASGAAITLKYVKDNSNDNNRDLGEISDFLITVNNVLIPVTPFNIDTYFTVTHGAYFFGPVFNITPATANLPGLMSATDKTKLDGIAAGANNYRHPDSVAGAKDSGLYKIATDANGHVTAVAAVTKSDITALGIPAQDTNTVYTHPTTAGYKHIPSGGSSGQYLKYSAAGTAKWATPSSNVATTSAAGFMSAADKKQLTDFQIVGIYFIGVGKIQYGFKSVNLTAKQATYGDEKCLTITMPAEAGTYMILPFAPQSRHYLTTYDSRWEAGKDAIVFHRDPNGNAGYHNYGVGFMLVRTTLSLTA